MCCDAPITDLLVDATEVFQDVKHALLLQHSTRVGLSKAMNPYAILLIHVTHEKTTAGLFNSLDLQQV